VFPDPEVVQSEAGSPRKNPYLYASEAGVVVVVVVEWCVIVWLTCVLVMRSTLPSGDVPVDVTVQM